MPVVINCSWCNKTMGTVKSVKDARDWTDGEICKDCLAKQEQTLKVFENAVERTKKRLDLYREEAVGQLQKDIKAIAGEV